MSFSRFTCVLTVLLYLGIIVFYSPLTAGPIMRDFEAYYSAGATWNAGQNPYGREIWNIERQLPGVDARENILPYINPPQLLPVLGALARLPFQQAGLVWTLVLAASLAFLILLSLTLAERAWTWPMILGLTVFGFAFGPVSSSFTLGQLALICATGLTLAAAALPRSAWLSGAGAFIAALQPPFIVPLVAFLRNWKAIHTFLVAGVLYVLIWIIMTATLRVPSLLDYATMVHEHANAERFSLIQYTPAAIAYGLGVSPNIALVVGIIVAVAAITLWAIMAIRNGTPVSAFCFGTILSPFIVQYCHEHDLAIVFPAITIALFHRRKDTIGWLVAAVLLIGTNWLWVAQRPDSLSLNACLTVALAAIAFMLARPQQWNVALFLPSTGVFLLTIIVAVTMRAHPAPLWPQTMHAITIPATANAAQAWEAQQKAAGLLTPNLPLALLRCLPLLGSLLLLAIYPRSSYRQSS